MARISGNFVGSFLQGLTQARQRTRQNELLEELTKTKIKVGKAALEREALQDKALTQFITRITGNTPEPGIDAESEIGTPGMGILEAMSDPEMIGLGLRGGAFNIPQLIQGQQAGQSNELLKQFMQGFGGQPGSGQAGGGQPGGGVQAGQLVPQDVVMSPGKPPAFKFGRTQIKNRRLNPENPTEVIEEDQFGNVLQTRRAGLDELQELDKPLGKDAKDWTNAGGATADPGMPMREAIAKGFKPQNRTQMSDAARVAIIDSGIQAIDNMKTMLFPDDKPVDQTRLAKILFQAGLPGGGVGEGRRFNTLAYPAVSGQILLLSGVAVRPEEREQLSAAFIPSMGDLTSEGLAQEKLENFRALLSGNLDAIMPSLPSSLQERIQSIKTRSAELPEGIPEGSRQIGTSGGNPVYETPSGERLVVR